MKPDFEYNFKSLLTAPAKALKVKKIFVCSVGLLAALAVYDILVYLALLIDGRSLTAVFKVYCLFPFEIAGFSSIISVVLYYLGVFGAVVMIMLGMLAATSCDFEELRGNPFFSAYDSLKFTLSRSPQLLISIFAVALFIMLIILLGILVGLVTRIPVAGDLLYALFFLFPNFVIAIFTVLIIFVFFVSFFIMPITVAADRNKESFNSILESFLTITRHPFRWGLYTAFSLVAAKVCGFIYAFFSYKAIQLVWASTAVGGGEKIDRLMASGFARLPLKSEAVRFTTNLFPQVYIGFDLTSLAEGGSESIAGYILAIMLFLIFVSIWGYMLSVVATSQAYSFAIIKFIRDGHKITDEDSLFYEEEWANPLIDEENKTKEKIKE